MRATTTAPTTAEADAVALAALRAGERESILYPTAVDEALKSEPTAWFAVYKQTELGK